MSKRPLVAVAMSGGVDSSVAALLLLRQGYQIVGLTMQLMPCGGEKIGGCCGIEAVQSAQKVCRKLGIPHYVINLREPFRKIVIKNFIQEYAHGHTPNPCVVCNEKIKFDLLLRRAKEIGATYLATGHYATIKLSRQGFFLQKGKDKNKDQSYFLYRLKQNQLKHLLFPLGGLTKPQVRQIASKAGLPTAAKPESQEICFIPDNNYRKFLIDAASAPNRAGLIVDKKNKILGRHSGLNQYTIGQRKGLSLSSPRPLYVIKINTKNNKLIVGPETDLYQQKCLVKNINWISGAAPKLPLNISAKIRYRSLAAKATLKKQGQSLLCRFAKAQRAITPGQSIVFYKGSQILGGGIIDQVID